MSDSTVREFLDENLAPLLPETWRWVPFQRNLDALDAVTVTWKQARIERLPEAPIGSLRVSGVLTIADPHQDIERAEEALDDAVLELVTAIDGLRSIAWSDAVKVLVSDLYIGWDVSISIVTASAPTTTEPPIEESP